jgi:DNA-directed RNA polymerase subunit N (RpoN/RPB10)
VVLGGLGASQVLGVLDVERQDLDHGRVARDHDVLFGARLALERDAQLALYSLGITRSCARREAAVSAFTADADTNFVAALGRALDWHVDNSPWCSASQAKHWTGS